MPLSWIFCLWLPGWIEMAVAFVCNRALSIPGAGSAGPDPLCKGEVRAGVSKGRRQASAGPLASPVSSEVDLDVLRPLPCGWETRGRRRGVVCIRKKIKTPRPPRLQQGVQRGEQEGTGPAEGEGGGWGGGLHCLSGLSRLAFLPPPPPPAFLARCCRL